VIMVSTDHCTESHVHIGYDVCIETSSDEDDSIVPICSSELCSDSSSILTSLPSSMNSSLHPTALQNTVFTEKDLKRTFRPIMVHIVNAKFIPCIHHIMHLRSYHYIMRRWTLK